MRYENWDVLLFPQASQIPIPEFRTECSLIKDDESSFPANPDIYNVASQLAQDFHLGYLPIVTTFIPSLPVNEPFGVSVHSWWSPQPSLLMERFMQPEDSVQFEARVFIDGILFGAVNFGPKNTPTVIKFSNNVNRNGILDSLRFPPFHERLLEQDHWEAKDLLGRIRVNISEGFSRPNRNPPFERFRNVVAFSFQHALPHILELTQIAWPNPGLWVKISRRIIEKNTTNAYAAIDSSKEPVNLHAHCPAIYNVCLGDTTTQATCPGVIGNMIHQISPSQRLNTLQEPSIRGLYNGLPSMVEQTRRSNRSTLDDTSMAGYMSSIATGFSSRLSPNMMGVSYEQSTQEAWRKLLNRRAEVSREPFAYKAGLVSVDKSAECPRALRPVSQPAVTQASVGRGQSDSSSLPETSPMATTAPKLGASPSFQMKSKKELHSRENKGLEDRLKNSPETPSRLTRKSSSSESLQTPRIRVGKDSSQGHCVVNTPTDGKTSTVAHPSAVEQPRRNRSTVSDISMPDYESSIASGSSSRVVSNMTGVSYGESTRASTLAVYGK